MGKILNELHFIFYLGKVSGYCGMWSEFSFFLFLFCFLIRSDSGKDEHPSVKYKHRPNKFLIMNLSGTTQVFASLRDRITSLSIMNMMMIIIAINNFYFFSICY